VSDLGNSHDHTKFLHSRREDDPWCLDSAGGSFIDFLVFSFRHESSNYERIGPLSMAMSYTDVTPPEAS